MRDPIPSLEEISNSYDKRFAEGALRESERFYRWVLEHLDPTPGKRLLDVSCGEGHLLKWASHLYHMEVWGVDISTVALHLTRQNTEVAHLTRCNGTQLPYHGNVFHYVTNLGSLEHYPDVGRGVSEMVRVLKPGGRVAILLPNSYYLADIVWRVWRTGYGPSHQQPLECFAAVGEWSDILSREGVDITRVHAYNFLFPVMLKDWQWYRERPRRFLNLLIAPLIPFNLSYCHLFIGRKPASQAD